MLSTGKIKVLANASDKRDPLFPDIPTMKEEGVNLSAVLWRGVVAPKGISKDKIAILEEAFRKATSDPEYVEFMKTRKFANTFVPHAEFAKAYYEEGKTLTALLELRFILPLLSLSSRPCRILGQGTLRGRPNHHLVRVLRRQGVRIRGTGLKESVPF